MSNNGFHLDELRGRLGGMREPPKAGHVELRTRDRWAGANAVAAEREKLGAPEALGGGDTRGTALELEMRRLPLTTHKEVQL